MWRLVFFLGVVDSLALPQHLTRLTKSLPSRPFAHDDPEFTTYEYSAFVLSSNAAPYVVGTSKSRSNRVVVYSSVTHSISGVCNRVPGRDLPVAIPLPINASWYEIFTYTHAAVCLYPSLPLTCELLCAGDLEYADHNCTSCGTRKPVCYYVRPVAPEPILVDSFSDLVVCQELREGHVVGHQLFSFSEVEPLIISFLHDHVFRYPFHQTTRTSNVECFSKIVINFTATPFAPSTFADNSQSMPIALLMEGALSQYERTSVGKFCFQVIERGLFDGILTGIIHLLVYLFDEVLQWLMHSEFLPHLTRAVLDLVGQLLKLFIDVVVKVMIMNKVVLVIAVVAFYFQLLYHDVIITATVSVALSYFLGQL